MPQYMLLIYDDPSSSPAADSAQAQQEHQEYGTFTQDVQQRGLMVSGAPLQSTDTATTVRVRDGGEALLTDGPFADTKEWLAGYYILECPDLDTATEQAARIPAARHGAIEVRPIMVLPDM
ncbi:MAG: hypothetical protein QOH46_1874 [Solirubrobacteraceae bacterium]|jgi:hypothetical protein|nr:hypothetical protein [Solirubrobacteraceae bacterium]MEA2269603.1 hypothetical protein [Solirubrobacteraceae bacterium]